MKALPFFILVFVFAPLKGYAYLDLGTGSYMLQILIATLIGGAYTLKIYWRKIKAFLKKSGAEKRVKH